MDGLGPIRRVVTGHDAGGRAVVLRDEVDPHKRVRPGRGSVSRLLWVTRESPALAVADDAAEGFAGTAPPARGSVVRIVDFPPFTDAEIAQFDMNYLAGEHGGDADGFHRASSHPFMHRTQSVDYGLVLIGEIEMKLDEDWVLLRAGDVVVQRATNHAWVNRSGAFCRIAFVLLDAASAEL
jgi:hypothetical protein